MADPPIRADSRAWTGTPDLPRAEYEVFSRRPLLRERRRTFWALSVGVLLGGMLAWLLIDLMIWSIAGEMPYFEAFPDLRGISLGISSGAAFAAIALLAGRRKLLPFASLPIIAVTGIVGGMQFFADIAHPGKIEVLTFYIQSLDLTSGRNHLWRNFRASANLVDRNGRHWTLNGRYAYIRALENQDCVTVRVRVTGRHSFPVGPFALMETPYIDAVTGHRHPERCFTASGGEEAPTVPQGAAQEAI